MEPKSKRKRISNFSQQDVDLLVDEVEMRKDILFNKFSSTVNLQKKAAAWLAIVDRINASTTGSYRPVKQVKKKWADIKSASKAKEESARRRHVRRTAGGPPAEDLSSVEQKFVSIIPDVLIEGMTHGVLDTEEQVKTTDTNCEEGFENDPDALNEQVTEIVEPDMGITAQATLNVNTPETSQGKSPRAFDQDILKIEKEQLQTERGILTTLRELVSIQRDKLVLKKIQVGIPGDHILQATGIDVTAPVGQPGVP